MENNSFFKNLSSGIGNKLKFLSTNPYREVNLNWLKLKYYKHLPPGKIRTHLLFGKPLYFYSPTELVHGIKEIFIEEMYKQDLQEKPYIIDCGANIGLSIIYMKQHYPNAEILAFEPDEKNFALLSKNIQSCGYTGVTLRQEAVWTEDTLVQFSNEGAMHSMIENSKKERSINVQAIKLKKILTRKIDFLKIDIEGAEYQVIKDCSDQLQMADNLFIEFHGYFEKMNELSEIIAILQKNNFLFYFKEAANVYQTPFIRNTRKGFFDIQLNIFCFKKK